MVLGALECSDPVLGLDLCSWKNDLDHYAGGGGGENRAKVCFLTPFLPLVIEKNKETNEYRRRCKLPLPFDPTGPFGP